MTRLELSLLVHEFLFGLIGKRDVQVWVEISFLGFSLWLFEPPQGFFGRAHDYLNPWPLLRISFDGGPADGRHPASFGAAVLCWRFGFLLPFLLVLSILF